MLALTGTSGGLGGAVLRTILNQNLIPPEEIVISSFSSKSSLLEKAAAAGIEIRHGDMTNPDTLIKSYAGCQVLFLVSYPSVGEERFKYHKAAIDAAQTAGVKHIIYTSLTWGGPTGTNSMAGVYKAHERTMNYLKGSGLSWTFVRESTYGHLWNNLAGFLHLDQTGNFEAVVSNDGPHHFADREELGEATAKIIASWKDYIGLTVSLTGPRAYTVEEIVKLYSAYSGRLVTLRKAFLTNWASWGEALAAGETDYVDGTLGELLGRTPKSIEDMKDTIFAAKTNKLDTKDFV